MWGATKMTETSLDMVRGDTKQWDLTFTDAAGGALDLSAITIWFTVKDKVSDTDAQALFQLHSPNHGIANISAVGGTARITVLPSHTAALTSKRNNQAYYDIQIVDGSGRVYTVADGTITIYPDVTIAVA